MSCKAPGRFQRAPDGRSDIRWEIHAPEATKASATSAWSASSRTSSLTRTLVSTARMSASQVRSDALVHVVRPMRIGRRGKQGIMDIPRGVLRRPPDDHLIAPLVPLDGRTRGQSQLLPNARRYRYLALRRDSGFGPFHPGSLLPLLEFITAVIFVRPSTRIKRIVTFERSSRIMRRVTERRHRHYVMPCSFLLHTFDQLRRYVLALENPPLLRCGDLWCEDPGMGQSV